MSLLTGGAYPRDAIRPLWKRSCVHSGVRFPRPYVPFGLRIGVKSGNTKTFGVPSHVEEFVVAFANMVRRGHAWTRDPNFVNNFTDDLIAMWKCKAQQGARSDIISSSRPPPLPLSSWDWERAAEQIARKEEEDHHARTELVHNSGKVRGVRDDDAKEEEIPKAIIDGKEYRMTRNVVDKSGIFISRGSEHPLNGRIRRPIFPSDVTLNMSSGARVPSPPKFVSSSSKGGWADVIHDPCVSWLARWEDPLTRFPKYVYLDGGADLRQYHENRKFEKARELKRNIRKFCKALQRDVSQTSDPTLSQLAACVWLIMIFGIRAGNDEQRSRSTKAIIGNRGGKGRGGGGAGTSKNDVSGTVGATSLRKNHITIKGNCVRLKFIGKDHVPYDEYHVVPNILAKKLSALVNNGHDDSPLLFDLISADGTNAYLDGLLPGLTCKVLRTYRASSLLDSRLTRYQSATGSGSSSPEVMFDLRTRISLLSVGLLEAAWLMNHRKAVTNMTTEMKNTNAKNRKRFDMLCEDVWMSVSRVLISDSRGDNDEAARTRKQKSQIAEVQENVQRAVRFAKDLRLSPQTAKVNYIDPRIVISYCKRSQIPIEKAYTSSHRKRFGWALSAPAGFRF